MLDVANYRADKNLEIGNFKWKDALKNRTDLNPISVGFKLTSTCNYPCDTKGYVDLNYEAF